MLLIAPGGHSGRSAGRGAGGSRRTTNVAPDGSREAYTRNVVPCCHLAWMLGLFYLISVMIYYRRSDKIEAFNGAAAVSMQFVCSGFGWICAFLLLLRGSSSSGTLQKGPQWPHRRLPACSQHIPGELPPPFYLWSFFGSPPQSPSPPYVSFFYARPARPSSSFLTHPLTLWGPRQTPGCSPFPV